MTFQDLVGETAKICRPAHTGGPGRSIRGSTEFRDSFKSGHSSTAGYGKRSTSLPRAPCSWRHHPPRLCPASGHACASCSGLLLVGKSFLSKKEHHKQRFPSMGENCRQGLIKQEPQIPSPSGKIRWPEHFQVSLRVRQTQFPPRAANLRIAPLKRGRFRLMTSPRTLEYMPRNWRPARLATLPLLATCLKYKFQRSLNFFHRSLRGEGLLILKSRFERLGLCIWPPQGTKSIFYE